MMEKYELDRDQLTRTIMANNVRFYFDRATDRELENGLHWYEEANRLARMIARETDTDTDLVIGIIAVMSPKTSWSRNVQVTRDIIAAHKQGRNWVDGPGLGANKRKAFTMLQTGSVFPSLKGPKVTRFYDNIRDPWSFEVTIDKHAFSVAINDPDLPYEFTIPQWAQELARDAYIKVAQDISLVPYQVQAVSWLAMKRIRRTGADGIQLEFEFGE